MYGVVVASESVSGLLESGAEVPLPCQLASVTPFWPLACQLEFEAAAAAAEVERRAGEVCAADGAGEADR